MKPKAQISIHAMHEARTPQQFPPLESVTKPSLTTAEYAYYTGISRQTASLHACKECGPLRPIRLPGSSLLRWPTKATKQLMRVA